MEINIMSATEARKRSDEVRNETIQGDIQKMVNAINRAVESGHSYIYFGNDDYCRDAFEALIPVLEEKGYCVEKSGTYVEVIW